MSGIESESNVRHCIWCGDPIPDEILFIDEEAECCSTDCMEDYADQLIMNFINWEGSDDDSKEER